MQKHHIDTSIILESEKTKDGRFCQRYLNKVRDYIHGIVSLPTLGELLLTIIRIEDLYKMRSFQDTVTHIIHFHKISFYTPTKNIIKIQERITELDRRIDTIDREILACSIEDKADYLITLDKDLIRNKKIETEFKIRICHPKDLL